MKTIFIEEKVVLPDIDTDKWIDAIIGIDNYTKKL